MLLRKIRTNAEIVCVGILAALYLFVPLIEEELFPFSRFSLNSNLPSLYVVYTIQDENNLFYPPHLFGLERKYKTRKEVYGKRPYGVERNTLNLNQEIDSKQEVVNHLAQELREWDHICTLIVSQNIYGAKTEDLIGLLYSKQWVVHSPLCQNNEF